MVKNSPANAGDVKDMDSIPELGRCVGEGIGKLLEFSCPENSMERGAWWATVHGTEKSQTQLSMSMMHCIPRGQIFTAPFYLDKARCGYLQRKDW